MAKVPDVARVKDVKLVQEFKAFIMRGNVVDLAVGIIIGLAFGTVVNSLVNDVIMPPIALLLGGVDFQQSYLLLKQGTTAGPYASLEAAKAAGAVTLRWGLLVNAVINFLVVAFAVFMLIKAIAKMKAKEPTPLPAPNERPCPECAMPIPLVARRCGHCTSSVSAA